MNKKGLSLIELLVAIFIVGVILGAAYFTYIKLLKGFKSESENISTQIENLVGLDILRLDLEHVGYGIPNNETSSLISWNTSSKSLTLRSTLNNTNAFTRGYLLLKCSSGSLNIRYDGREDTSTSNKFVSILNATTRNFFDKGEIGTGLVSPKTASCSNNQIYIAYPVRKVVYDNTSNGCSVGYCEQITYELSNSDLISRCNPNTSNLIRRVGTSTSGGEPILNCVADWTLTFDIDDNGNGIIEASEQNKTDLHTLTSNADIRSKLKAINVYILVQEGRYDPDFTYNQAVNCSSSSGKCVNVNGVLLGLPSGFEHYRWKPLMIKVKPMDL